MKNEAKLLEIMKGYNRFWTGGTVAAGIRRDVLSICMRPLRGRCLHLQICESIIPKTDLFGSIDFLRHPQNFG
jgi:hypothetical protein